MDLELEPKPDSPLRCAVCHDQVNGDRDVCEGCGAVLHTECRAALTECPTLGCGNRRPRPLPLGGKSRRRWRRAIVAIGLVLALGVGGVYVFRREARNALDPFHRYEDALSANLSAGPDRQPRKVVVALQHLFMIPGQSAARVELCDEDGDEIHTYEFSTGWRIDCESARVVPYPGRKGVELLQITCSPAINGRGLFNQFYGVTPDDRLALVRLETEGGAFGGLNTYAYPNHTIGPWPPSRTPAEWKAALDSQDPVRVLEALMWIGGHHVSPGQNGNGVSIEEDKGASDAHAARTDSGVLTSIRSLATSTDPWIAQAARAGLTAMGLERLERNESIWQAKVNAKDWEGALAVLQDSVDSALEVHPESRERYQLVNALETRARLYMRLGRLPEADADFTSVLKIDPTSGWSHLLRGCTRLLRGDAQSGLADLQKAAELRPQGPYPALWAAAATGAPPSAEAPAVNEETWLLEVRRFVSGEIGSEELLTRVEGAGGKATRTQRLCVAHCFIGMLAERNGDGGLAKAQYKACLATGEDAWIQFDWANYRISHGETR